MSFDKGSPVHLDARNILLGVLNTGKFFLTHDFF